MLEDVLHEAPFTLLATELIGKEKAAGTRVSMMTSCAYGNKTCNCNSGQEEEMSTGSGVGTTQEATV